MILDGELYRAPISDSVSRVLDIGTGTGIWAIDMADKFPNAHVTGMW
jgi:methylase of polypeptide subunit release factors